LRETITSQLLAVKAENPHIGLQPIQLPLGADQPTGGIGTHEGHSINKLQNGIIVLIFKM